MSGRNKPFERMLKTADPDVLELAACMLELDARTLRRVASEKRIQADQKKARFAIPPNWGR